MVMFWTLRVNAIVGTMRVFLLSTWMVMTMVVMPMLIVCVFMTVMALSMMNICWRIRVYRYGRMWCSTRAGRITLHNVCSFLQSIRNSGNAALSLLYRGLCLPMYIAHQEHFYKDTSMNNRAFRKSCVLATFSHDFQKALLKK